MIILSLNTKTCMSKLLLKDSFDSLSFIEGEITTFNKFTIDGYIHKEFYEDPPANEHTYWRDIRDYCFSIIKGKRTPLNFKLILSLAPEQFPDFLSECQLSCQPEDVQGLYLNLRYDGTALSCVTGVSMKTFSMDKSIDAAWDSWVKQFLDQQGIAFEVG